MSMIKKLWRFHNIIRDLPYDRLLEYVNDLLINSGKYRNVQIYNSEDDLGIDIIAQNVENLNEKCLFEIKKANLVGNDVIYKTLFFFNKVKDNKKHVGYYRLVIVSSGSFTESAQLLANTNNIELWDFKYLFSLQMNISNVNDIYYYKKPDTIAEETKTLEDKLIEKLKKIEHGRKDWIIYQKIISDIFEHLFCPPLDSPRYELSDFSNSNRRDMIFENISENGVWHNIREIYKGYYIVVDAKNYSKPIGKRPIVDVAHYLKPYGCGMFGIIVCRKGLSTSGLNAIIEQWIGNEKMIVVLSDEDMIEMLKIKKNSKIPEELLRRKIADFRMKL